MRRGGRKAVFRNVKKPSKKEVHDENRDDSEEEGVEVVNQDMWNSLWMKILQDLRDDEYLFGMFRESLHRTLDKMNPLINYYSSGMGIEMLEKVLMECQLLSVTSYPYITEQQVEDIKALLQTKDNGTETPVEESKEEDPEQQTIKRLKWGASIREIRIGNFEVQRSWLRQFALQLNTSSSSPSLDINMFKYMPEELPIEINRTISKGPTRELMQHFMRQFNRFEVSRVLRIRILLDSIEGINFFHSEKNESFGLLTFLLKTPPSFSSRRISSQTDTHNEWKERIDFTTNSQASKFNRIYLCGDYEELETIVAALIALNPNFKQFLTSGIQDIGDDTTKYDLDNMNNIPPLTSDLPKVFPLPYSFQVNNIEPDQDSLLHSDIDSDTDEPVWLGWNDNNNEDEDVDDDFVHEFKRNMHHHHHDHDEDEDFEDDLPDDLDEEEAEEFIEQLHHLGIDPSHLFSQMGADDYDEEGPYDEEDDEDYEEEEDDEEGPYHRGHRGGQPQCAQQ